MVEKTVVVSLTQNELTDLEAILLDEEKEEALRFLREVVKRKIDAAGKSRCRPATDAP